MKQERPSPTITCWWWFDKAHNSQKQVQAHPKHLHHKIPNQVFKYYSQPQQWHYGIIKQVVRGLNSCSQRFWPVMQSGRCSVPSLLFRNSKSATHRVPHLNPGSSTHSSPVLTCLPKSCICPSHCIANGDRDLVCLFHCVSPVHAGLMAAIQISVGCCSSSGILVSLYLTFTSGLWQYNKRTVNHTSLT